MTCGRYVGSERTREHLQRMAAMGVGMRQIEVVSGVGHTRQWHIRTGRATRIHPETERAILGVCGLDRAPGSRIPAGPTWELIDCLVRAGVRRWQIAEALGNASGQPSSKGAIRRPELQLSRTTVSEAHAAAVRAYHDRAFMSDPRVRAVCSHVR